MCLSVRDAPGLPSLADGAGEKEREMFETLVEVNSSSILSFQHVSSAECGHVSLRASV